MKGDEWEIVPVDVGWRVRLLRSGEEIGRRYVSCPNQIDWAKQDILFPPELIGVPLN